jgi:hypothetical protein
VLLCTRRAHSAVAAIGVVVGLLTLVQLPTAYAEPPDRSQDTRLARSPEWRRPPSLRSTKVAFTSATDPEPAIYAGDALADLEAPQPAEWR